MDSPRLFFAVDIGAPAEGAFRRVLEEVKASGADANWAGPGPVHLTLAFLGKTSRDRVEAALSAARRSASAAAAFTARLSSVGVFPSWKRPRVLWLGVGEGGESLGSLGERLRAELKAEDFPLEDRPFVPHATLARLRSLKGLEKLKLAAQRCGGALADGAFEVRDFVLFESRLEAAGAKHTELARLPLGRAAEALR